jgi:hypothetical protein
VQKAGVRGLYGLVSTIVSRLLEIPRDVLKSVTIQQKPLHLATGAQVVLQALSASMLKHCQCCWFGSAAPQIELEGATSLPPHEGNSVERFAILKRKCLLQLQRLFVLFPQGKRIAVDPWYVFLEYERRSKNGRMRWMMKMTRKSSLCKFAKGYEKQII